MDWGIHNRLARIVPSETGRDLLCHLERELFVLLL